MRANAILNLHVTTTRKHDMQIAPLLISRNAAKVGVLLENKGYGNQQIRAAARENEPPAGQIPRVLLIVESVEHSERA